MAAERESASPGPGEASPGPGEHVDPATFSVIMGAYQTIAREMVISLERSAWTPIISQCRDFSVTICDGSFNLIAVPDETLRSRRCPCIELSRTRQRSSRETSPMATS